MKWPDGATARPSQARGRKSSTSCDDYFRIRDFEFVQPLYDLAFLLEVDALARTSAVPKYRTFSLWRAALRMDGYGTTISRWMGGQLADEDLDYVPSSRIKQYLVAIRDTGTVPELRRFRTRAFDRVLRLRSVRGLGPAMLAQTVASRGFRADWLGTARVDAEDDRRRAMELYDGIAERRWQSAHVVPPLLRFLRSVETYAKNLELRWSLPGHEDPLEAIVGRVTALADCRFSDLIVAVKRALKHERFFQRIEPGLDGTLLVRHQLGWELAIETTNVRASKYTAADLACQLDPLVTAAGSNLLSDLHVHTSWSDGAASIESMAVAAAARGLQYIAITDHSRSSKLQNGLTPIQWLRQRNAITSKRHACGVLHGIEVDILKDGTVDLPDSILSLAELVVASIHSTWTTDTRANTERLIRAIESGRIDVLGHPTTAVLGKPGVPDYVRRPAVVQWDVVFAKCALWRVAVEFNCFPSRLDLPLGLLRQAITAGCAVSFGSDAHARSHLLNLSFSQAILRVVDPPVVLNRMAEGELRRFVQRNRKLRERLRRDSVPAVQIDLFSAKQQAAARPMQARIRPAQRLPPGARVVGVDLTAGTKLTGLAFLNGSRVDVCSLSTDQQILDYIEQRRPAIVSIDSPLGLPGGHDSVDPSAGIVRVAEYDLASIGIPAYPALIDSMESLTLRGIRLRRAIERLPRAPRVIESYPGAAQDILCLPRKQRSLASLREGLRRLGIRGVGLETSSHDEIDAVTSAVVGRFFEVGQYEPMGIASEAQLIVPKVSPLVLTDNPIICLSGKTGAGKSVIARYFSVFYGFHWVRTRDLIRDLLIEDATRQPKNRIFSRKVNVNSVTEADLRDFGALILYQYDQVPLRQALATRLKDVKGPVVVDAIRSTADVKAPPAIMSRIRNWFVDCSDSMIRVRMAKRTKLGVPRLLTDASTNRTAPELREGADAIIGNHGSLEDLRWRVDDILFAALSFGR